MFRIGVTGHRHFPEGTYEFVRDGLERALLTRSGPVEALSSLAVGADQLFAEVALAYGAALVVVIPSGDYEDDFVDAVELARYRGLKKLADREVFLGHPRASDQAYYEAGRYIADHCDLLLAVWDGKPARGLGGTADIVAYAQDLGKEVLVIWSPGAERA